ncbi:MAG: DUF4407 domain-containing protein, partial [Bacteroidota bacterium]
DWRVAIGVGVFWGLLIFNLDRFIVASLRKKERKSSEWLAAMPRLLLALLFAVVIAKPLELKIFENEISTVLPKAAAEQTKGLQVQMDSLNQVNQTLAGQIDTLEKAPNNAFFVIQAKENYRKSQLVRDSVSAIQNGRIDGLKQKINREYGTINKYKNRIAELEKSIPLLEDPEQKANDQKELDYKKGLTKRANNRIRSYRAQIKEEEAVISGQNETVALAKAENDAVQGDRKSLVGSRIAAIQAEIDQNKADIEELKAQRKQLNGQYKGLLASMEALSILKAENMTIWIAGNLIFLLFVAVEIAPILVKIISPRGPYDDLLAYSEAKARQDHIKHLPIQEQQATQPALQAVNNTELAKMEKEINEKVAKVRYNALLKSIEKYEEDLTEKVENGDHSYRENIVHEAQSNLRSFLHPTQTHTPMNGQGAQNITGSSLEDHLWQIRHPETGEVIRYQFDHDGQFAHIRNGVSIKGTWQYLDQHRRNIQVSLNNRTIRFRILQLGQILELQDMNRPESRQTFHRIN